MNSLKQKKFRNEHNLFIAEGTKIVSELLVSAISVKQVFATSDFCRNNKIADHIERYEIKENELERISALISPNEVLAVCEMPHYQLQIDSLKDKITLVLDDIKDPGNLGTIIRIADWFGISTIICSNETVDAFNPKVVQATMGSISRIKIHYVDLVDFFKFQLTDFKLPVYGALLDGNNIYSEKLPENGFIIIGNESQGISEKLLPFISNRISIPSFSQYNAISGETESLNAAIATSIICSEFRRSAAI